MSASRALRWLAIGSVALATGCGGHAGAQPPVAPVAAVAPRPSRAPAEVATPPAIEPIVEPPPVEAVVAPPPVEPVVALAPCPDDRQRDVHQKPDHVVELAQLSEAMTVIDLGSGSGYFLCRLSRAVGSRGRVVATEIGKQLVRGLKKRVEREQLSNVEVVLAPTNDVGVAPGTADRILVVNVWHHIVDRKRYAARVARALSPGGKVVVVDFKPAGRRGGHGIAPERVLAELAAGGIDGAVISEELPDQYVIIGAVRAPASDAPAR